MKDFTDQMGRTVRIDFPPKRIVSLVPSQTELLFSLGLDAEVVGITKFCVHPKDWFRSKQRIGGTKQVKIELIRALNPDLIIGNKEENTQDDIEQLSREFPVWMSDIVTMRDALEMIEQIGLLTNRSRKAGEITSAVSHAFDQLSRQTSGTEGKKVAYLIWKNPYMLAGKNTFVDAMLHTLGLQNITSETRYPVWDPISGEAPDLVFLSSEPYPFRTDDCQYFQTVFPGAHVVIVDGEYFSWYGSRLMDAPAYFEQLLRSIT